jgi:hypothetical protein
MISGWLASGVAALRGSAQLRRLRRVCVALGLIVLAIAYSR